MDIFDVLSLIGGLSLFLFGMNVMGDALERRAGGSLKMLLGKLTKNKMLGLLTGLAVTAVIQSSSATTVMVVGFVNSGLMALKQAINVIMGANIGTTVTAWILSLGGISGDNIFVQLLKPTSFTPVLALIGTIMLMSGKSSKSKDTGTILLGFATLMFGMDTMTDSVSNLADIPAFQNMFIMFKNPILGVLVGAVLTAIIQSSSASVGILQALAITGQVSYAAAIPIIMGQNIGTCITAILASFGTNKNAKRAGIVHLLFNIIGTIICLVIFAIISYTLKPVILNESASLLGIAVCHSLFNVLCTVILFPMSSLLEKIAIRMVPDSDKEEETVMLDERIIEIPAVAISKCNELVAEMGKMAVIAVNNALEFIDGFDDEKAEEIRTKESKIDKYEDMLGTYLVKLSSNQVTEKDSIEISKLLKAIGDFERISDHSVNILESYEEIKNKEISFTEEGLRELRVLSDAVTEILDISYMAYVNNDSKKAMDVEPLEEVIDKLKSKLRNYHIKRLQDGECSILAGFVWSDIITNLERIADHCSNIAVCVIDANENNMNIHESLKEICENNNDFEIKYNEYLNKYSV